MAHVGRPANHNNRRAADTMSDTEDSIEEIAQHAAEAVAAIDQLRARAPAQEDRDLLAKFAGAVIAMSAAYNAHIRGQVIAVGADPSMVETAIRRALTPAQVAELAARLQASP
jgi:hypothetical protein